MRISGYKPCVVCGAEAHECDSNLIIVTPKHYCRRTIRKAFLEKYLSIDLCENCSINIANQDNFLPFCRAIFYLEDKINNWSDFISDPFSEEKHQMDITEWDNEWGDMWSCDYDTRISKMNTPPIFKVKVSSSIEMDKELNMLLFKAIQQYKKIIRAKAKRFEAEVLGDISLLAKAFNDTIIYKIAEENGIFTQAQLSELLNISSAYVGKVCRNNPHKQLFKNFYSTSREILNRA